MTGVATILQSPGRLLGRLTGPILDKELRIASRRKRYYFLRLGFILVLLIFLFQSWFVTITFSAGQSAGYSAMRMSEVSRGVVCAAAWLEFLLLPVLAGVMLSDSISREVSQRTLEVLLTTPITCVQLVAGKVLSRLLPLVLLIGITLPLFAVIRVFGGVPWDFVVVSLAVTMTTTCLFAGFSLFYSIGNRNTYRVIVHTFFTAALLFGLLPGLLAVVDHTQSRVPLGQVIEWLHWINPYVVMAELTQALLTANPQGMSAVGWERHCIIIGAAALGILLLSAFRLGKRMRNLSGGTAGKATVFHRLTGRVPKGQRVAGRPVRELKGHPVFWNEMQRTESGRILSIGANDLLVTLVAFTAVGIGGYFGVLMEPGFHAAFVTILALVGFLRTAVLSAMSISVEKQSGAWPILLTTPLENREILKMKIYGILRKTAVFWILIAADVFLFSAMLVINPFALLAVPVGVIPSCLFLFGVGLYFGMRLKTTTGTLAVTFAIPLALWYLCPCFMNFSPLALIGLSVAMGTGEDMFFPAFMVGFSFIPAIVYGAAGYVFLILAKNSMRKYIFSGAR